MANTTIQIKRSTSTAKPVDGTLSAGEPAYSYSSNIMFIGSSAGSEVLAVGGKFYVDRTNSALEIATAAFVAANAAASSEVAVGAFNNSNAAFDKANSAESIAVSGFDKANSANVLAFNSGLTASASYDFANTVSSTAIAGFDKANTACTSADVAQTKGEAAHLTANIAFDKANSAETIAIAAFADSNGKLSLSGGTITGTLSVNGNFTVSGNTYYIDTVDYRVNDPLIRLANNNTISDTVDIGFFGTYSNGTTELHTGLVRNYEDKEYYLFKDYTDNADNNNIDPNGNNFTIAVINADLKTSNLVLGGQNTINWITAAYTQANVGSTIASAAYDYANTVGGIASGAFDKANSANLLAFSSGTIASAAFNQANTANINAANASFLTTGIVGVGVGGTGVTSFTSNGILFGNGGGALNVTSAGTEGQVLQAGATGIPSFGMLDGGSF